MIKPENVIRGSAGSVVYVKNGKAQELGCVQSFKATIDIDNTEIKRISLDGGMTLHKQGMMSGSWEATVDYSLPVLREYIEDYKNSGLMPRLKFVITNDDASSTVGKQIVTIKECLLDSIPLVSLDAESEALTDDISGTFDDFDINTHFDHRWDVYGGETDYSGT